MAEDGVERHDTDAVLAVHTSCSPSYVDEKRANDKGACPCKPPHLRKHRCGSFGRCGMCDQALSGTLVQARVWIVTTSVHQSEEDGEGAVAATHRRTQRQGGSIQVGIPRHFLFHPPFQENDGGNYPGI